MKTQLLRWTLWTLALVSFVSCSNEEDGETPPPQTQTYQLALETSEVNLKSDAADVVKVAVTSAYESIDISVADDAASWLDVKLINSDVVFQSLTENMTGSVRNTIVELVGHNEGQTSSVEVSVSQAFSEEGGSTPKLPDGVAIGALLGDGVIVGLADDGSYAIVMSLQSNEVYWHDYEEVTQEALIGQVVGLAEMSNVDGFANTAALLSKDPDGFPAALHCQQMGEGWYLPSSSELAAVRNDLLANIDVIDATIGANSGVKLNAANAAGEIELQEFWWTSNDLPTLETNTAGTKYFYKAVAYRFVDSKNSEATEGLSSAYNGYKARYVRGFKKVFL